MGQPSFVLAGVLSIYIMVNGFVIHNIPIALSQPSTSTGKSTEKSALTHPQSTNNWTTGTSSPIPKMESAYTSIGDKIYIIAGYGETGKRNKNSVEVYDSKNNTWTTSATPIPVDLNHAAAASYNGKIYVVGGYLDNKIPPTDSLFMILLKMPG
jgi:Kelch motif